MKGKDDSSPDVCPWERTQNIREITRLEICPGCEWFEPYIGHTSPGVCIGKRNTLRWLQGYVD